MINNDVSSQLSRFFANRGANADSRQSVSDIYQRLKAKHDSIRNGKTAEEQAATNEAETEQAKNNGKADKNTAAQNKDKAATKTRDNSDAAAAKEEETLSPMERRKKELDAILARLNAEEEARNANRFGAKDKTKTGTSENTNADANANVTTSTDPNDLRDRAGTLGFLNDLPLFNEFKSGLMDAFKQLDSSTAGSINAQYELNYTSMQYIADEAGNYDYKEVSFSMKLDLNYIKAASGGQTGKDIADAIGSSEDFASMVENLQKVGQSKTNNANAQQVSFNPKDMLNSLQDYFSPEKTAGRIVDFATAFFPLSDAFKSKGDTEEARTEFADTMRKAIQKGFDQAQGILGAVPKKTQEGIDKTHELTMKGIDDFIKNGMNKQKEDAGVYDALEQFSLSFQMSYSEKSVSVRNYNANGVTTTNQANPALDTQA